MNSNRPRWLVLASALQVSLSPVCMGFAIAGCALACLNWQLANLVWPEIPSPSPHQMSILVAFPQPLPLPASDLPIDPVVGVPSQFILPVLELFRTNSSWWRMSRSLAEGMGAIVIWSFFGLAIMRIAIVQCGQQAREPVGNTLKFAARNWWSVATAPVVTIAAIMLIAIPVFAVSWLIRFDVGVLVIGVGWILVLLFAALMTVLLLGLLFSWPLMWGAIATEDSDLFDAISRSFAYTLQRPVNYLGYLIVAAALGVVSWALACWAKEMTEALGYWAIQVGGGAERTELIRGLAEGSWDGSGASDVLQLGAQCLRTANRALGLAASAFSYSLFWSIMGGIYLLLRFDTDGTSLDDIVTK